MIFDATAEVDQDYYYRDRVEILSGTPRNEPHTVNFYIHSHRDLKVSKSAMKNPWKLPAFAEYAAQMIWETDGLIFICTYKQSAVEFADRIRDHLSETDFKRVLLMPQKEPPTIPYFNGTNGSNAFHKAETVIIIGYPRLDPSTYLAFACAACGYERIAGELADIPEERRSRSSFPGTQGCHGLH